MADAARTRARRGLRRLRKASQYTLLAAFLVLLTLTVWPLGHVYLGAFLVADPLIAANSAMGGVLRIEMLLAVVVLLSPLLLGRAFCGYVCPTGALAEAVSPTERPSDGGPPRMRASRVPARARAILRALPPYVLIACGGLLLFASGSFLFFDPLTTLTRSATVLLYPALDRLTRVIGDVAYLAPPLRGGVDAVTSALTGRIVFTRPLTYGLQLGILGYFGMMLGLSRLEPRLWCRHLCPLGALLGLTGRFALFGRVVDAEVCIQCGKCEHVCPLDAVSGDHLSTDTARCQLGLECAEVCPTDAIRVGWLPSRTTFQPSRRALLGASGATLLAGFFTYTGLSRSERDVRLIRPPGARTETEVLGLCSRCGQCMKVCPTNVLQPAVTRAGIEGVFTPQMDYRLSYCDWSCSECGKVCPTGAIMPLALEAKRKTTIGRAYIDRNRCIPWADYKTCLVCQELCPIPDKAIALREVEVDDPRGGKVRLGRPEVLVERCIGCGVCENACPVPNESAIVVRAVAPERRA
ncbi:MAG: 4Fe-4S binding protein [Coriobacteriia bacterium]|nr:4Fe-4S binding protein [Coriobacteriia bacterium]